MHLHTNPTYGLTLNEMPCCPGAAPYETNVKIGKIAPKFRFKNQRVAGAPEEISTPDPQILSLVLLITPVCDNLSDCYN